ncbi:MAG: GntR family transcriptional regulator [Deltaproteobacteria bacterium]|nr:GntR family transcriptional regulator [Deltaproteobacteria bacterium]
MRDFRTMTEIAAHKLRRAILFGELTAGTRLIPAKLEVEMDLSRVSIREAIRELVGSGLVESTTHKGAFVAEPLDLSEIKEIFKVRYDVEGRAAFLGTKKITDSDIVRLEEIVETEFKELPGNYDSFFLNNEFHMILYRASGWRYLIKMIARINDQTMAYRASIYQRLREQKGEDLLRFADYKPFHDDHLQILAAIKAGNAADVRKYTVINKKRGLANITELSAELNNKKSRSIYGAR